MRRLAIHLFVLIAVLLAWLPASVGAAAAPEEQPIIESDPFDPSTLPGPSSSPTPGEVAPALTFWCSAFPLEQGWAVRVTHEWNALHPDRPVRLQALPPDRLAEDVFREAIKNGTTPDVTNHLFPVNAHEFASQGALLPLDADAALMQHLAARSGAGADGPFRSPDGHLYQLPWKNNPILFQYNLELFRRSGVQAPRTYTEFLDAGRQLAGGSEKTWLWSPSPTAKFWERYYDFFPLFLAASGGQGLLTADGRANFDNEAGLAVMQFLSDLYREGAVPRTPQYDDAPQQIQGFLKDQLAMIMTGPWNIEEIRDAGGEKVTFDFVGMPVPDGYPADKPVFTYGNFRNWGIFKSCRNPALASEFMRFATSRENDLEFLRTANQLPYRQGLTEDPEFVVALQRGPATLSKFALQSPWVRPVDNVPYLNDVLGILSEELVASAVEGRKTPRQALSDAAARTNRLAEARKR